VMGMVVLRRMAMRRLMMSIRGVNLEPVPSYWPKLGTGFRVPGY
jgi:hypothetical protein